MLGRFDKACTGGWPLSWGECRPKRRQENPLPAWPYILLHTEDCCCLEKRKWFWCLIVWSRKSKNYLENPLPQPYILLHTEDCFCLEKIKTRMCLIWVCETSEPSGLVKLINLANFSETGENWNLLIQVSLVDLVNQEKVLKKESCLHLHWEVFSRKSKNNERKVFKKRESCLHFHRAVLLRMRDIKGRGVSICSGHCGPHSTN